jgi:tRNA modification GTPase
MQTSFANGILAPMKTADVIVALATGAGSAAIGVVRLSGPGAWNIALTLCRDRNEPPPERRLVMEWLSDPSTGRVLDQALVAFFCAGASYTGEEAVELYCHGGPAVLDRVLMACLRTGARSARPGEFTRRAVVAGRMDLLQAEGVALLAMAGTEAAVDVGLGALSGRPSAQIQMARESLLDLLADVEAALDHSEEDGVVVDLEAVAERLGDQANRLAGWLQDARMLRPAVSGVRIALVGVPNAGKSSLFNALLGRSRAIVHADPGTTRDVVGEQLPLAGICCQLLDTAGLRDAGADEVEAEGMSRAADAAREADIVVLVVDGALPQCPDVLPAKVDVVVVTKADLPQSEASWLDAMPETQILRTSCISGEGLNELRSMLAEKASEVARRGDALKAVVAGQRQIDSLTSALRSIETAGHEWAVDDAPLEAVASGIRRAVEFLGEVDGSRVTEEVLDRVFQRFCVGK